MKKIVVLASGSGTNFKAICDLEEKNYQVIELITNNENAFVINRAKKRKINFKIIKKDSLILDRLLQLNPDLIVLAGYMKLLKDKRYFTIFKNKIINIHPSLLPSFKGLNAQKQALDAGVKFSGCTIHFVDESLDGGKIIWQEGVFVGDCKTEEEITKRIRKLELFAYPRVIKKLCDEKENFNCIF